MRHGYYSCLLYTSTEVLDGKNGFAVENKASIFEEKIQYILSDENIQDVHKRQVMFGSPETTTGGNALKYYASVRLSLIHI